tara:strand:- start:226 stop:486 length:261 start_codon:yes stop_codon:yes gene_type:complete
MWLFKFVTCSRRELHDYEHSIEVEDQDSFVKAVEEARKQLPLGEKDNIYNNLGVEWELIDVQLFDYDSEIYTNDKDVSPLCGSVEL